ncbi:helix-turn-helix domain-containing protein [Microbispora cellulosiformans]|uniref:Helix-turn-helix domain-containing protein n=1 Tax=Microbispora cellulosiformans TaxID=2614688 RepID=A0A5J5K520_9ACTN|nr:helix-turn-helix domain-containing protein [Microbispora cellulosiformans]KAA9379112.1 helix-turn-helix domain-containing protein [Microbispora cellulosiformans]
MALEIESRPSDSPYIERVWRSTSQDVSRMTSVATANWDLVFWEHRGQVSASVQGPETRAAQASVPEDATFFGIVFALGTSMPHLPANRLVDAMAEIPDATRRTFHLKGSAWCLPSYDNAEMFVRRMVREDVLVRDPVVAAVLDGASPDLSERTLQRRFLAATGLTRGAVRQIDRARRAAVLIRDGVPAVEVVHRLGYFDQPHLARSLARYVGQTATRLSERDPADPVSLLYKT